MTLHAILLGWGRRGVRVAVSRSETIGPCGDGAGLAHWPCAGRAILAIGLPDRIPESVSHVRLGLLVRVLSIAPKVVGGGSLRPSARGIAPSS